MSDLTACPRCGSEEIAPIIYGLPGPEAFQAAERGEVILGGCEPHDASHGCRSCGAQWGSPRTALPDGESEAADRIASIFNQRFRNWNIEISSADVHPGNRDSITHRGWRINYVVGIDDAGELFLEYYATHRMTNDRHSRISGSGAREALDTMSSMVFYDPNVGGHRERASRENIERNKKIAEELKAKGCSLRGISTRS